jgi:drug/metabolite transporter (DMT)-like permease
MECGLNAECFFRIERKPFCVYVVTPMTPLEEQQHKQHRFRIALSFALVYVFWGSTYLAMRVAVATVPPYAVGSTRYLISGLLMLLWCALTGRNVRVNRRDLVRLLAIGVLLLSIANVGVLWAERYVTSGLAALIVAIVPIWVVVLETWVFRVGKMPVRGLLGLALGIGGMVVLLWPKITAGTHLGRLELFGAAILIFASLSWALGSILSHRWTLSVDVFTSAAWQMLLAGLVNAMVAALTGQFSRAVWRAPARWAIAYLVLSGSLIGYTAYIWLLEHVPPPKVATYAYVNPVVAVFLGWLLLHESVDIFTLIGTVVIIGSVALVNTAKLKRRIEDAVPTEIAEVPASVGD